MANELVRIIESTQAKDEPIVARMPGTQKGRVHVSDGVAIFSNCDVNQYDDTSKSIYNALCADEDIANATMPEGQFDSRDHRNHRVVFNLPTRSRLNQLDKIFYILAYQENSQHIKDTNELVLPTTHTLGVKPVSGEGMNAHNLPRGFSEVVKESDLPSVAVRETKRILAEYGHLTIDEDQTLFALSMYDGVQAYIDIAGAKDLALFDRIPHISTNTSEAIMHRPKGKEKISGREIKFGYRALDKTVVYFAEGGVLHRAEMSSVDPRGAFVTEAGYDRDRVGWVRLGRGGVNLDGPVSSVEEYLRLMGGKIKELQTDPVNKEAVDRMGFHLAGFAKAAGRFGDSKSEQRAYQTAETAFGNLDPVKNLGLKLEEYDNSAVAIASIERAQN